MRRALVEIIILTLGGLLIWAQPVSAGSLFLHRLSPPLADPLPDPYDPTVPTPTPPPLKGYTGLPNPALGHPILSADPADPLAGFSRRPLDRYLVAQEFLDPTRPEPHFGIDYTYPEDYLRGNTLWVHPIGPGFVTARSSCWRCFVDGDAQGRVPVRRPEHNFGFGTLVIVETPYNTDVSIYVMYAHLNRDFVSLGDYITPDDLIGVAGSTGYSENVHVHVEVRYGPPGRFWNADFTRWETRDRWLATMFMNPAWLIFAEHHPNCVTALDSWAALQPRPADLP
jgi:hypothetical protein